MGNWHDDEENRGYFKDKLDYDEDRLNHEKWIGESEDEVETITQNYLEQVYGGSFYELNEDEYCYESEDEYEDEYEEEQEPVQESIEYSTHIEIEEYIVEAFRKATLDYSEKQVEELLENEDLTNILANLNSAGSLVEKQAAVIKVREASRVTINKLKDIYNHRCQICGENNLEKYNVSMVEAHHIEFFSKTQNHSPNNIMILCPTHHKAIHLAEGEYDRQKETIIYTKNGRQEKLILNKHLTCQNGNH